MGLPMKSCTSCAMFVNQIAYHRACRPLPNAAKPAPKAAKPRAKPSAKSAAKPAAKVSAKPVAGEPISGLLSMCSSSKSECLHQ